MYNITFWQVPATTVAMKKQRTTYSEGVSVAGIAHEPYYIAICDLFSSAFFHIIS